jgi:GTP-binding protein EngB required for normal cell division
VSFDLGKRVIKNYSRHMTTVMEPTAAAHLTVALGKIDRLLKVETNRSKHMVLVQIRTELADGIAHLVSDTDGAGDGK